MSPIRSIVRTYRAAFAGLPREIWLLCGAAFVNRAGTMVLPFLALFLREERTLSIAESGRLVAVYGLGSLLGSYLGGWLADRIGSIRTQQLSLLGAGLGYVAIIFVSDIFLLAAVVFATSVVGEAFRPAVMSSIAHRAPGGLVVRSFALLRLAVNLGMAVGPAVGGFLAVINYDLLFVADAVTGWIAMGLLGFFLRPARAGGFEESPGPDPAARSPWHDRPFLALTLLVALFGSCLFQVFSTMPLFLRTSYALREDRIGLVLALNATIIALFEMVLIHKMERANRMVLIGIGAVLVSLGLSILPLGSTLAFALLSTVVWTLGEMLVLPLTNAAVADRATPATRGRYMGMYTMAFSLAFVIGPIAGTWVLEHHGPAVLWFGIGLLGIPQLAAALALARPMARRATR